MGRNAICLLAVVSALLAGGQANGAVFSSSTTQPEVDGFDIASFGESTGTDKWWADRADTYGNPGKTIGQTFTTGDEYALLTAFTFQIAYATEPQKEYVIRVGTVSGNAFTEIASETATQTDATLNDAYWTWTLESPVLLLPNTVYGVDVGMTSSTSAWQTGIPYVYYTADEYPGGTRFRSGTEGYGVGDTGMSHMSGDRSFHVNLEKPTTLYWDGLGDIGWMRRTRRWTGIRTLLLQP